MTLIAMLCVLTTVGKVPEGQHVTELYQHMGPCRPAPELMADQAIAFSNVFRERARAKACNVKPFQISGCKYRYEVMP
jgi:hypothetical protein